MQILGSNTSQYLLLSYLLRCLHAGHCFSLPAPSMVSLAFFCHWLERKAGINVKHCYKVYLFYNIVLPRSVAVVLLHCSTFPIGKCFLSFGCGQTVQIALCSHRSPLWLVVLDLVLKKKYPRLPIQILLFSYSGSLHLVVPV